MRYSAQGQMKTAGVQRGRMRSSELFDVLFVPLILALMVIYLAVTTDSFLSMTNLITVLNQAAILAIAAFVMTFVIMAKELDLSIGTGSALMSVIGALVMVTSGSVMLAILAAIGAGLLLGLINGALVAYLQMPSFIVTLGTMIICQAIALALTNGGIVTGLPAAFTDIARFRIVGVPMLVICTAVFFFVMWWVQRNTAFSYRVQAVGGNDEAARLSGISVSRVRLLVFAISGGGAGLVGLALLMRVQSGQPNANTMLALEAIAAVVVGGTSLHGGRGGMVRTLWGVLLIATLRNGLDLSGISEDYKNMVIGAVFILAASVDFVRTRLSKTGVRARAINADPSAPGLLDSSTNRVGRGSTRGASVHGNSRSSRKVGR